MQIIATKQLKQAALRRAFATLRSGVSKPSVNQLYSVQESPGFNAATLVAAELRKARGSAPLPQLGLLLNDIECRNRVRIVDDFAPKFPGSTGSGAGAFIESHFKVDDAELGEKLKAIGLERKGYRLG